MERVEAHDGLGRPFGDDIGDPRGAVRGDELELTGPVAERVEELPDGILRASLGGPDHPASDVVAHHGQVLVAFLVLDLVDRDGDESVEQIDPAERLIREADTHVVDCSPRDPVAVRGSLLVPHDGVVNDEVLERPCERGGMAGPRHHRHRWTAAGALHAAGQRHQFHRRVAGVEVPPRPDSIALVEPRREVTAAPAPAPPLRLRTHVYSHHRPALSHDLDSHDHHLTGEPQNRLEYLADAHAVPSSLPGLDSSEARERAACAREPTHGSVS